MMRKFMILACAGLLMASCTESKRERLGLQVQTREGVVEGFEADSVKKYLGIPFAKAPVGDLRWRAPQPADVRDTVLQAKAFGNDPMQLPVFGDMNFRGPAKSEDCLYLNIWTPAEYTDEALPVLIYFNGGGLIAGSGSEPRYDGTSMARKGVIGVTANYREGIFGFLAHPELSAEAEYGGSGNYGLLDQAAAIQWVADNIAAFGGDPKRITIAGESAGSFSVSTLMASPLAKDNLAGVIGSSGAEFRPREPMTLSEAEAAGKAALESKGITDIASARAIDADSLQAMMPVMMAPLVIDGYYMSEGNDEAFAAGHQAQVPMLVGWNSLEGTPSAPTVAVYKESLRPRFGEMTDSIFEAFGILTDADLHTQAGFNLAGALFTAFPTWQWAKMHAESGNPVYRYVYNHPRPQVSEKMGDMTGGLAGGVRQKTEEEKKVKAPIAPGAVHSADIEYAMGNLSTNEYYDWQPEDYAISDLFITYYANFCKTGNPNGEGLPEWTALNGQPVAPVMQIDVESHELVDPALENAYGMLDKVFNKK